MDKFFGARCRPREDHPLQAFDQITDEIATRYMRPDLQRSRLDPVSAGFLHELFPVLKSVVEVNMDMPLPETRSAGIDGLEAASRLSIELRKNGPLIIIIEDVQWADRDSLAVLERLCDSPGGSLGVVTSSPRQYDQDYRTPDWNIELRGLPPEESIAMLAEAADRWQTEIEISDLRILAEIVEGNPFRLAELAEEFRDGGLLSSSRDCVALTESIAAGESLHWLCQRRVERLSPEARRILPIVVAAGRPVSIQQIDEISELGEHVDVPLSELVQQRLVADQTQTNECIAVAHDRVSAGLVAVLSKDEIRAAHRSWANWLLGQDQPHRVAARVAGHLFDADEPSRAVSSAILAAKQSEGLYAHRDAAQWYERVLPFVAGTERNQILRDAARCYELSDQPIEAAKILRELAKFVGGGEQIDIRTRAVKLLIRSGRFQMVRRQLRDLTTALGLPSPKRSPLSSAAIMWQLLRLKIDKGRFRRTKIREARAKHSLAPPQASIRQKQRLQLCIALARPLSMFDNHHASELNLFAARLALDSDDVKSQIYIEIGFAVFSCYAPGALRAKGENILRQLRPRVEAFGNEGLIGDYWAAIAFSNMFSCRWHLICQQAKKSTMHYGRLEEPCSFEISHTKSICFWSMWHLGKWEELTELQNHLLTESAHRNDRIQQLAATTGLSAAAWLIHDQPGNLIQAQNNNEDLVNRGAGGTVL